MVEQLAGRRVVTAANCTGGFSPGLASRLTLADGSMIFVGIAEQPGWSAAWPQRAPDGTTTMNP